MLHLYTDLGYLNVTNDGCPVLNTSSQVTANNLRMKYIELQAYVWMSNSAYDSFTLRRIGQPIAGLGTIVDWFYEHQDTFAFEAVACIAKVSNERLFKLGFTARC